MKAFLHNKRAMAGAFIVLAFVAVALLAPIIDPYSPYNINFIPVQGPSSAHWLGTTAQGQDILSQVLYGARASLLVGFSCAAGITLVQLFFGVFSGYAGGWTDNVLSTITNIWLVLPSLPLLIIITAYVQDRSTGVIIVVLIVTGWPWGARVLRSQAIALRDRPFVEAARMSGDGRARIVLFNIVPNMFGIMAANFFGAALYAVLAEAGLEFLGLGNPGSVTWGTMLFWVQEQSAYLFGLWVWMLVPGLCILLLGTGLGLLNFAVDEVADPRLRRS